MALLNALNLLGTGFGVAATVSLWLSALSLTYAALRVLYNIFLHPLRSFPGPLLNRATVLTKCYYTLQGEAPYHVTALHAKYGSVVRIAPNELAFTDPDAWKDMYSRKSGQYEIPHDFDFYNASGDPHRSILNSEREEHDEVRKLISHGFSERAMRAQEPVISGYVDTLIQRLSERCVDAGGAPKSVNMCDWIPFTTFDLIGRLVFGSDFGCLENSAYHPWIQLIMDNLVDMAKLHVLKKMGILPFVKYLMEKFGVGDQARQMHLELTGSKTKQRIELGTGQNDFLDALIKSGMQFERVQQNAAVLIIAGSETSATVLCGTVYFLVTHPEVFEKLKAEVRGQFQSEAEITLTSVNVLSYMLAVLNETLRCYPPVAIASPRRVGQGGAEIAGRHVPEGAVVGIWQWAMYHNPSLFADPYTFNPERFVQSEKPHLGNGDRLDAVNPFLTGPRNCLGQTLAYAETRLILARIVWSFDMELSEESQGWLTNQRNYLLWHKPDLNVFLYKRK